MNRKPTGRHRVSASPRLTVETVRDRWHDSFGHHLDRRLPFGRFDVVRSADDAAALARIDLLDRVPLVVSGR